jgi:hypothetical protein
MTPTASYSRTYMNDRREMAWLEYQQVLIVGQFFIDI